MPTPYIEALKDFNAGKPSWCIPRRGTSDYLFIRKMMDRTTPAAVAERNKEREAKATEQLKALDTRPKIENRRRGDQFAKKMRELLEFPRGFPSIKQINFWGRKTDDFGRPPYNGYFVTVRPMTTDPAIFVQYEKKVDQLDGPFKGMTKAEFIKFINGAKKMESWENASKGSFWRSLA